MNNKKAKSGERKKEGWRERSCVPHVPGVPLFLSRIIEDLTLI
jgi:hypothetical protein